MGRTQINSQTLDVTQLQPLRDQVLVEILTQHKIGMIEIVQQKGRIDYVTLARVMRVGSGIHEDVHGRVFPIELEPGDYVIMMDYTGERIKVNDKSYRIMREHGLWAKVVPGPESDLCNFIDVQPRFDTVMIKPKDEEKTESGTLFLAQGNKDCQYRKATVVKTGPGVWFAPTNQRNPVQLDEGQEIVFQRYAGADITVNGEKYRLIQECDIITGC